MRLNTTKNVRVTWVYESDIYQYESVPGSIVANSKAESIRFELRDVIAEDDNFQVVIQKNGESYTFKSDYYPDADREFPLRLFLGQQEAIFYYEGSEGRVYLHLTQ